MTETILKGTVKDVLAGRLLPDELDRNTARLVLRELQAGRCKGNPKRLLARRLSRMAQAGQAAGLHAWQVPPKARRFMEAE